MLSNQRNKKAAKRFFKKLLGNKHTVDPRVINVDKSPTFPPALDELKATKEAPQNTKLRAVKYLNNSMENDHKSTKSKSRYRQWYQSFSGLPGIVLLNCRYNPLIFKVNPIS